MSPARRVHSHVTRRFAATYPVDFLVRWARRSATTRDWRTWLSAEPPEPFFASGRATLTPATGRVVGMHDGETDDGGWSHERR